jgi:hypothetical protein
LKINHLPTSIFLCWSTIGQLFYYSQLYCLSAFWTLHFHDIEYLSHIRQIYHLVGVEVIQRVDGYCVVLHIMVDDSFDENTFLMNDDEIPLSDV